MAPRAPRPDSEPETSEPAKDSEQDIEAIAEKVWDKIEDRVGGLLGGSPKQETPDPEPSEPRKRMTYRDEEFNMSDVVKKAISELKAEEKAEGEKHPEPKEEKADPEPVPAQPKGRKVESFMGWK